VKRDDLGMTHARFRQVAHGLEVVGGDFSCMSTATVSSSPRMALPANASFPTRLRALTPRRQQRSQSKGRRLWWRDSRVLAYVISSWDRSLHLAWEVIIAGRTTMVRFATLFTSTPVWERLSTSVRRSTTSCAGASTRWRMPTIFPGLSCGRRGAASLDPIANRNYDNFGRVYQCFQSLFGRDSYDGRGAAIVSSVHFGFQAANAAWNGEQFWFGDGDARGEWASFALAYDITAHEFTHAVTQFESNLVYMNESGALNESMSDVFAAVCEYFFPPPPELGAVNPWHIWRRSTRPDIPETHIAT